MNCQLFRDMEMFRMIPNACWHRVNRQEEELLTGGGREGGRWESSPVREANRGSTSLILQDLAQVDTGLQSSQDTSRSGPDQREGTGSLESSVPSWVRLCVQGFVVVIVLWKEGCTCTTHTCIIFLPAW